MALRKALGWSAAQSAVRMVVGFVTIKVTAVYLGPSGLAIVGQLNNFLSMATAATAGGMQTGVTKMTAELHDQPGRHAAVWASGLRLVLILAVLTALATMLGSVWLAQQLMRDAAYWPAFVLAALAVMGGALNALFNGILNGSKRMHALALGLILSSLLTLFISVPLVYGWGVRGGLAGCALGFMLTAAISASFLRRELGPLRTIFSGRSEPALMRSLLHFYPMTLANAVSSQLSMLCVRYVLVAHFGLAEAGIWQASQRISDTYTAIIVQALSLFLMPHLAGIREPQRFRNELFSVSAKAAGMSLLIAAAIYVARDQVILVLFTPQFAALRELFPYQLLGDVLMVACWPLRMGLVARVQARQYIAVELLTVLVFVAGTALLAPWLGLRSAPLAYLSSFAVSLACLLALHTRMAGRTPS